MNGIILDVYNTGNPYPRYMNLIAKSAGNTDSNIGFWTEAVGGSPTEKLRIAANGDILMGGLTSKSSESTAILSINGGGNNIGIINVHSDNGENGGDLSGITFSHGGGANATTTSRAKCAIASRAVGSYGRGHLCFYVDGESDNNGVAAADEKLRITTGGSFGFNTSSINIRENIHTHQTDSNQNYLRFTNTGTGSGTSDGFNIGITAAEEAIVWNFESTNMLFATDNTERINIDSTGTTTFVGDSGGAEQIKIQSNGGGAGIFIGNFQGLDAGDASGRLGVGKNDNALIFMNASGSQVQNFAIGNTDAVPLVFSTHNTRRLTIAGDGDIGIGVDNPSRTLEVQGSSNLDILKVTNLATSFSNDFYTLRVDSSAHTSNMTSAGAFAVEVNSGRAFTINGIGNVGIGTNLPTHPLDVFRYTDTSGSSTGTTLLRLTNAVGSGPSGQGDILSPNGQRSYIDFRFLDGNINYTPQVRIGAQVGKVEGDTGIESEGFGSFVVYTAEGSGPSGGGSLTERFRITGVGTAVFGSAGKPYQTNTVSIHPADGMVNFGILVIFSLVKVRVVLYQRVVWFYNQGQT